MASPKAAIDLGTNSARLLIGTVGPGQAIQPIVLKKEITRLGGGFSRARGLSPEACERSISVLHDFAREITRNEVREVRAAATSAVRDAVNGREFADQVFSRTGISLEIIDGREEALLTLRGVLSGFAERSNCLVFDIGGGSTEYTIARDRRLVFTRSLPLGVVRLTEGKCSVDRMDDKISRELAGLWAEMSSAGYEALPTGTLLVGTAGTATTLAAIDLGMARYDSRLVQGHVLSLCDIREIYRTILPLTPEQRLLIPGMEKGREDLAVAGILLTIRTMEMFGFDRFTVSDSGLLEGLLLST